MIRDPSDGSVREKHEGPICKGCGEGFFYDYTPRPNDYSGFCENCFERPMPVSEPGMTGISPATSGLPAGSSKPEELARLERSREFVRDYHAKKDSHRNTEGAKE